MISKTRTLWKYATLCFFAVLAMGQLQRIDLAGWPAFYIHDLLLGGFVATQFFQPQFRQLVRQGLRSIPRLGWLWLGWILSGLVIAAIVDRSIVYSVLSLARLVLYVLGGVGVYRLIKTHQLTTFWLSFCLSSFFGLLLYFGFLQYFLLPDTRFLFFTGWDDHLYRLISTIFDPGFTGLLLVLGLIFFQQSRQMTKQWLIFGQPLWLWGVSVLLVLATLLTYSRASYLAMVVALGLLAGATWRTKSTQQAILAIGLLVMFVIGIFSLPRPGGEGVRLERTSTITARTSNIAVALLPLDSPITLVIGQGLFTPYQAQETSIYTGDQPHARVADNWLVMLLNGTGVIGLGLSVALLGRLWWWAKSQTNSWLWIGLSATIVHGMFNASLTYPFVWLTLLTWGVITLGMKR